MSKEFIWAEVYRPRKVSECILPDRLKSLFQAFVDQKAIPSLILSGPPGTGKTSVAKAMCDEIGINYLLVNGAKDRGIDTIRNQVMNFASTLSISGNRKVVIIDEADGMSADGQNSLKGVIESVSSNCTFIFTCNFGSKLIEAIHSRCVGIDCSLSKNEKVSMAALLMRRLSEILTLENITFEKKALAAIIQKYFLDYRRIVIETQAIAIVDGIRNDSIDRLLDKSDFTTLFTALKAKNFKGCREWLVNNADSFQPSRFYWSMYENLKTYMKPESIPQAVLIFSQYEERAGRVANQEINSMACLTELMRDCVFL